MDPKACLLLVEEHIRDGNRSDAKWCLKQYRHWRSTGGFEPIMESGLPGDRLALDLAHQIIDTRPN